MLFKWGVIPNPQNFPGNPWRIPETPEQKKHQETQKITEILECPVISWKIMGNPETNYTPFQLHPIKGPLKIKEN